MLPDRIDKSLDVLHWCSRLNDVSGSYHIASSAAENFDFSLDVSLDQRRRTEGQKALLIDGAPERKPITKVDLQFLRCVPRNVRLNRVEDLQTYFNPF